MSKADKDNLDNLCLRTKFLRENAAQVDDAARAGGALGMYWRLHAMTDLAEATVRDLRDCAMVTDEQQPRLEQAQAKFAEASALLRECYDTEQASRTQR